MEVVGKTTEVVGGAKHPYATNTCMAIVPERTANISTKTMTGLGLMATKTRIRYSCHEHACSMYAELLWWIGGGFVVHLEVDWRWIDGRLAVEWQLWEIWRCIGRPLEVNRWWVGGGLAVVGYLVEKPPPNLVSGQAAA